MIQLFYLLNNLPSIEKWKEEVEESGEEKGDMDVQRDLNHTNVQELSTLPETIYHVTHNKDRKTLKTKQNKKNIHKSKRASMEMHGGKN